MPISNKEMRPYVEATRSFTNHNQTVWTTWEGKLYVVYSYGRHFPMYAYDTESQRWFGNRDKFQSLVGFKINWNSKNFPFMVKKGRFQSLVGFKINWNTDRRDQPVPAGGVVLHEGHPDRSRRFGGHEGVRCSLYLKNRRTSLFLHTV